MVLLVYPTWVVCDLAGTVGRKMSEQEKKILEQQGLDLDVRNVGPESTKVEACKGCVVFVDDDLKKLIPLQGVVPYRFLLTHEYNLTEKPRDVGVERIIGWPALYREIKETK